MEFLLIAVCTVASVAQNFIRKKFNAIYDGGAITFSAIISIFALLFFIYVSIGSAYAVEILPYSLLFAVSYALATVMLTKALAIGPLAISSLIMSYSLIIPMFYGAIFCSEKLSGIQLSGIILLMISLFLIRTKKSLDSGKLSIKWLICVVIAFFGNGMCAATQRMQQIKFSQKYDKSFMVIALIVVVVMLAAVAFFKEKNEIVTVIKKGWHFGLVCGACNGVVNLLVIVSLTFIAASLFFPLLAASQLVFTFLISKIFFKETFSKSQILGFVVGMASVILMNM